MINPKFDYATAKHFPRPTEPGFDMGKGDDELPPSQTYGKPRIVSRVRNGVGVGKKAAEAIFKERGIKYDEVFCDARWWCAAVYE